MDLEIHDRVNQHHTTLYGVEGQNGLLRKVDSMGKRLDVVEERVNSVSAKWLVLMAVIGILGNALGQKIVTLLSALK